MHAYAQAHTGGIFTCVPGTRDGPNVPPPPLTPGCVLGQLNAGPGTLRSPLGCDAVERGVAEGEASEDQRVALSCLICSQEDIGGDDEEDGADCAGAGEACGDS